jgi:hypothetical protein
MRFRSPPVNCLSGGKKGSRWWLAWLAFDIRMSSVVDPDPGSGALLIPASGIRNSPDPEPIFVNLIVNFLGKKHLNSL